MECMAVIVVLPRAVCIVVCLLVHLSMLLVLIHKAGVVCVQAVGVPAGVVVCVLPLLCVALVMALGLVVALCVSILVLVMVIVVCVAGLLGVWRGGHSCRGRGRDVRLLVGRVLYMCRGVHGCSLLRGGAGMNGRRRGSWRNGSRDRGAGRLLVVLLVVLGLCVCWWQVVKQGVVLCDLGLDVLGVLVLVVRSIIHRHVSRGELGAQTVCGIVGGTRRAATQCRSRHSRRSVSKQSKLHG